MNRIILFPLMLALFVGVTTQGATQASTKEMHKKIIVSQRFTESIRNNSVNFAQNRPEMDEKTALNLVWQLPQVQRKARTIQQLSRRTIKVAAIVDGLPTADAPYYTVRIYEDQPDHNSTIYWFRVSKETGVIEALDVIENKYISLEEWQKQINRRR